MPGLQGCRGPLRWLTPWTACCTLCCRGGEGCLAPLHWGVGMRSSVLLLVWEACADKCCCPGTRVSARMHGHGTAGCWELLPGPAAQVGAHTFPAPWRNPGAVGGQQRDQRDVRLLHGLLVQARLEAAHVLHSNIG